MKTLNIVLVEDEPVTARNLAHVLQSIDKNVHIVSILSSVYDTVSWLSKHEDQYDLIFMDIRLTDGLSFDVFKKVKLVKPVIFVTAYHDYTMDAFKNNGIDYILKPFDEQEVARAIDKFKTFTRPGKPETDVNLSQLIERLQIDIKPYKKSFLVHYRAKLLPIETAKIAWFYTANEIVYGQMLDGREYIIDFTMEQLEKQIDPQLFFRANRQFIINRVSIIEVDFYFNGRLSLKINPAPSERVLISKARVPEFKAWMNY